MLMLFTCFILISFTCVWAGFIFHYFLDKKTNIQKSWVVFAFTGLLVVSLFVQIVVLILPVNGYIWVSFILLLSILSLGNKVIFDCFRQYFFDIKTSGLIPLFASILLIIFFILLESGPTLMDDTESYHIQNIKWIQEYGTVPGLVNLHERYGFNSSWFTIIGFFIPARTSHNYFTVVNGAVSAWFSIYLFTNFWNSIQKIGFASNTLATGGLFIFFLAMVNWVMIRGNATTSNYDFITCCMIVVLFIEVWNTMQDQNPWQVYSTELLLWPVFLFTVRIINYPLLLISLFVFIDMIRQKKTRQYIAYGAISALLIIPFLIRNIIISGYIFFPIYQVDIFSFDWKADLARTKNLTEYIHYFNRVSTGVQSIEATKKLTFPGWIPVWFNHTFNYDKPVLLAGIAGYATSIFMFKKVMACLNPALKIFLIAMVLQLLSWFVLAPDPRFVHGPLLIGAFLLSVTLSLLPGVLISKKILTSALVVLFSGIIINGLSKMKNDSRYRNLVFPYFIPAPSLYVIKIDKIEFHIPAKLGANWNARCYNTNLPCIYEFYPGLKARGQTIAEGFRIKQ